MGMDLKGAFELVSKHEEKYKNKMKNFISVNQKRFDEQQKILSENSKIETPKKLTQKKRNKSEDLLQDLRIAEFKNLQSDLGTEFAEFFSKLDLKIISKHEKGYKLLKDTLRKADLLQQKKRYSKADITSNFYTRIQERETQMKSGILKRLKFLIDFGKFEKQNLQLKQFDDRLTHVEEKMQNIQTESKARFRMFVF